MTINLKLTQHWVPIFYLYYVIFHFSPPQYVCCPQFMLKCLCPLGYSEQKVIRLRCNTLRLRYTYVNVNTLIRLKHIQKSEKILNIFSVGAGEVKTQEKKCYTHPEYLIICLFTRPAVHTGHLPNCSPRAAGLQFDQLVSFSQHETHSATI